LFLPQKNYKDRTWFRFSAVIAMLLAFGAVRIPIESRLEADYRAEHFFTADLNLGLYQRIGQESFLAALGGLRAGVADYLWILAHIEWTNTEWGKMLLLFNNVTALQPRNIMFWDMSAWHMAYNASAAAMQDTSVPRIALRLKHQHEYFLIGVDILQRGIANNPDRYKLRESLANVLRDKLQDHCAAAEQFAKVAAFPDAPTYAKRFAAYELSYCPGHEHEAYDQLLKYYRMGEKEWLPTLLSRLNDLQNQLNIPQSQRVNIPANLLPKPHPNP
jgi:hypothetical protein